MLKEGNKAPALTLLNQNGEKVSLKNFLGNKVVLYFYPKDMTSGCTTEACDFRDAYEDFSKLNAVILGISKDTIKLHQKFAGKYELPFILLSDEEKKINQKYEVWKEKSMYGKKYFGTERTTFIIDEKGRIAKIFPKVKVKNHVEEVKKFIENM